MTDDAANLVVEQLKLLRGDVQELRVEQQKTNVKLEETNVKLEETNVKLDDTRARVDLLAEGQVRMGTAMIEELQRLGRRIDRVLLGPMGAQVRDHEARITRLEERVDEG